MNSPAGQAAIHLREALWRGDVDAACAQVGLLDEAHRVEILLGGALRRAADGFAAVGSWRRASRQPADSAAWRALCVALAAPATSPHDERAAGWVASGLAPETVPLQGPPLAPPRTAAFSGPGAEQALLEALRAGFSVEAMLACWPAHPLLPGVRDYYAGGICALGPRALLYLAIVPAAEAFNA